MSNIFSPVRVCVCAHAVYESPHPGYVPALQWNSWAIFASAPAGEWNKRLIGGAQISAPHKVDSAPGLCVWVCADGQLPLTHKHTHTQEPSHVHIKIKKIKKPRALKSLCVFTLLISERRTETIHNALQFETDANLHCESDTDMVKRCDVFLRRQPRKEGSSLGIHRVP